MIWSNIALEDEARVPTIDRQVDGRRGDPPVQQWWSSDLYVSTDCTGAAGKKRRRRRKSDSGKLAELSILFLCYQAMLPGMQPYTQCVNAVNVWVSGNKNCYTHRTHTHTQQICECSVCLTFPSSVGEVSLSRNSFSSGSEACSTSSRRTWVRGDELIST